MPRTKVVFYEADDGSVPFLDWFDDLQAKAQDKCRVRLQRLADLGHELRRPVANYLRDGIYELRVGHRSMNYRIIYFFHGRTAAIVSHGLAKERRVPPKEIDLAIRRKIEFERAQGRHTHNET